MGFRSVEPEPDEPSSKATPAVPMRWVAPGAAVVAYSLLPVVMGVTMGVMSTSLGHHPPRVIDYFVRDIDHSELEPTRRVYPDYPDAALEMDLPSQRCLATVVMDEDGKPFDVKVDGCPEVFHQPTVDAMRKWRWNPPMYGGHPIAARTTLAVTYTEYPESPISVCGMGRNWLWATPPGSFRCR